MIAGATKSAAMFKAFEELKEVFSSARGEPKVFILITRDSNK